MKTVLVLEDEASIRGFIVINLRRAGYEVIEAESGEEALERLKEHPDTKVALLDIMLPGIDGFEVCKEIREKKNLPIIMVSAKKDDIDKIRGLGLGADDYMTKPFSPSELVARVKAHLARYERLVGSQAKENDVIEIRGVRIDKTARRVYIDDVEKIFTTIKHPSKTFPLSVNFLSFSIFIFLQKYNNLSIIFV